MGSASGVYIRAGLKRLLLTIPIALGVSFLVFVAVDLAPGDPATSVLGTLATPEQRERFATANNLDDPLPVRFVRFLGDSVHGDFGVSLTQQESVIRLIGQSLPVTLQLTALAATLALLLALVLAAVAAWFQDRWPDRGIRVGLSFGIAAPDFWLGLLAVQIFAVSLGLVPTGGYVPFGTDPGAWLESVILPSIVLAIPMGCALGSVLRASLVQELGKDYVRTALGAGLSRKSVLGNHVLKNALLPTVTVLGLRLGYLISGVVVIESVFDLPGLGTLLVNAVNQGDLSVVRGVALVTTVFYVVINIAVDMAYLALNPKLRQA